MRLAIMSAVLLSASCACWTVEHAQEPKCVIAHQIVDCTKEAVISSIAPMFVDLLYNQTIDWNAIRSQIMQRLAQMGFKDGGCLLAALEAEFMTRQKTMGAQESRAGTLDAARKMETIHSLIVEFKQHHGVSNVQFKVKTSAGQEILQ